MAVVTLDKNFCGLSWRPPNWAKLIRRAADIDLARTGGYAWLPQPIWCTKSKSLVMEQGDLLLVVGLSGYQVLTRLSPSGQPEVIPDEEINATLAAAILPDRFRAEALNSHLYKLASYAWVILQATPSMAPQIIRDTPIEKLWNQVLELPEYDQVTIRNRLMELL